MAHKKTGGGTRNGRDSESKRLGVKMYGGQVIKPGSIIVVRRGFEFHAGCGVESGQGPHLVRQDRRRDQVREERRVHAPLREHRRRLIATSLRPVVTTGLFVRR